MKLGSILSDTLVEDNRLDTTINSPQRRNKASEMVELAGTLSNLRDQSDKGLGDKEKLDTALQQAQHAVNMFSHVVRQVDHLEIMIKALAKRMAAMEPDDPGESVLD